MIEPYQWLRANAPFLGLSQAVIGPCSVDLTMGGTIRAYNYLGDTVLRAGVNTEVLFQRGWFYLVATQEVICVPPTHCAFVHMRSSYARMGLGHKMAGLIGFCGENAKFWAVVLLEYTVLDADRVVLVSCLVNSPTLQN